MINRNGHGRATLLSVVILFFISGPILAQDLIYPTNGECFSAGNPLDIVFQPETVSPTTVNTINAQLVCKTIPTGQELNFSVISPIVDISIGADGSRLQASFDISDINNYFDQYYCLAEFDEGNGYERAGRLRILGQGFHSDLHVLVDDTDITTTVDSVTLTGGVSGSDRVRISGSNNSQYIFAPQDPDNPVYYTAPDPWSPDKTIGVYGWSHTVSGLTPGINNFEVRSTDCNDGYSEYVYVSINYAVGSPPDTVTPFDLSVESSGRSVSLDWAGYTNGSGLPVSTFKIYQSEGSAIDISTDYLTEVSSSVNSFQVSNLQPDQLYYFGIVANNGFDSELSSASVTTVDTLAPIDVSNTVVMPVLTDIYISWDASPSYPDDVTGYKVYLNATEVGVTDGGVNNFVLSGSGFTDADVIKVTAVDDSGNESVGNEVTGFSYPANPSTFNFLDRNEALQIDWSGVPDVNAATVDGYYVYYSDTEFSNITDTGVTRVFPNSVFPETPYIQGTAGQVKYFAVTTKNSLGFEIPVVQSHEYTFVDLMAPANPGDLSVDNTTESSFRLNWSAPNDDDLAGYQIFVENYDSQVVLVDLPLGTHEFTLTGLDECRLFEFQVRSVDTSGNISFPGYHVAYTKCPVVSGLQATPQTDRVDLTWDALDLSWTGNERYEIDYEIFVSELPINDISSLTPVIKDIQSPANATEINATVSGLDSGVTYYFVVAARSSADNEIDFSWYNNSLNPLFTVVSARTLFNNQPPVIGTIQYNNNDLVDGMTLSQSGTIVINVTDDVAVGRVEFSSTGNLSVTDGNGGDVYSAFWDLGEEPDGPITLTIDAYDTVENQVTETLNLTIEMAPPAIPSITSPTNGTVTAQLQMSVTGMSGPAASVDVLVNGTDLNSGLSIDQNGQFQQLVNLQDGNNTVQARAVNSRGTASAYSPAINILVDQSIPATPAGLQATEKTDGVIRLTWNPDTEGTTVGYNIYRSSVPFDDVSHALKINAELIDLSVFNDMPTPDGEYFYRITGVNDLGVESEPSNQVSAIADSTPPSAVIEYTPSLPIYSSGRVDIRVIMSEELLTTPYLGFSLVGGVPITVSLSQVSTFEYVGHFELGNQKLQTTAHAILSAYDLSNNRGTEVTSGSSFLIDTKGPVMDFLELSVESPIEFVPGDQLTAIFELDETPAVGTTPQLFYQLSGENRELQEITDLTLISSNRWQGSFTPPIDAGLAQAETLTISFLAMDDQDNIGNVISANETFQIYQGSLPPYDAPFGLNATALPAGAVQLSWFTVPGAAHYDVFRKPQGAQTYDFVARTFSDELEFIDELPKPDGDYEYAVASVRIDNATEAVSGPGFPAHVYVDSVVPEAPTDLMLSLVGSGIYAQWTESAQVHPGDEFIRYNLYRSSDNEITDVSGLTPIIESLGQAEAIDGEPSEADHAYVVTATDRAGNESAPSVSQYLNFNLLPVKDLVIDLLPNQAPVISWSHNTPNAIDSYEVYNESGGNQLLLGTNLSNETTLTDVNYTGSETVYSVVAIDENDTRSVAHKLRLPLLSTFITEGQSIKRGLMNELSFVVENFEDRVFENVSLVVSIGGEQYDSAQVTIASQGTAEISLVIPGNAGFTDLESIAVITRYQPNLGESANIHSTSQVIVEDGGLVMSITTDNFVKGTNGLVQLMVQNPGEKSIDLITARNTGANDSDQIRIRLEDADGNVLNVINFKQALGTDVINLPNGTTIARIEPGAGFTSVQQAIAIPESAASNLVVVATIDQVYHDFSGTFERQLQGIETRQSIIISETSYYGELTGITPEIVVGEGSVTITGRALNRLDDLPVTDVPLTIALRVDGFEQTIDVYTDDLGNFSHVYTPTAQEAGIYHVSVVHPDILDRPLDGSFEVAKLNVRRWSEALKIPFNVEQRQSIDIKAPRTLEYNNVRFEYVAADQPGNSFLQGIQITEMTAIPFINHQAGWLPLSFNIEADNSAPEFGQIVLRVVTDDTGGLIPATFTFDYELSDAEPVFYAEPSQISTGVSKPDSSSSVPLVTRVTERLVVSNQGFSAASDVAIKLLDGNYNPAPPWAVLMNDTVVGDMGVGQELEVSVTFTPTEYLQSGNYEFYLHVTADNATERYIPYFVQVVQSGNGGAQFKAADVYTLTPKDPNDVNSPLYLGLAGATIKLIHEVTGEVIVGTTDDNGEYLFSDIPVGKYIYRASKSNHNDLNGRITVRPGITVSEYAFLTQDFITIEWSVTETSIIDRYEIVMNLTFETNVPAAVVVIKPVVTNLPDMYPGDVYSGVWEIKNEGLIRANNFVLNVPGNDEYFSYEVLSDVPISLEAKETIYVPFRIINHKSLVPGFDGNAGGGGCGGYGSRVSASYEYDCADDQTTVGSATPAHINYTAGSSCPTGQGGDGGSQPSCNGRPNCGGFDPTCHGPQCPGSSSLTQCAPECDGDKCCSAAGGGFGGGGGGGGGFGGGGPGDGSGPGSGS